MDAKFKVGMAALLAAGSIVPALVQAQVEPDLQPVLNATVRVQTKPAGRNATGWVIQEADPVNRAGAAVVVTSLNVVEPKQQITVDGKAAIVLASDTDRNLVFLEVKDIAAKALPLTHVAPKPGQSIWASGFNRPADDAQSAAAPVSTIKRGSFSREYRGLISTEARADVDQIEHDAPLIPGFEGGPLIDQCGRVIGLNMKSGGKPVPRSGLVIQSGNTNMNALKGTEIIAFANTQRVQFAANDDDCSKPAAASSPGVTSPVTAPVPATGKGQSIVSWLKENVLIAALGVLGLLAVGFGIFSIARPKGAAGVAEPTPPMTNYRTIQPPTALPDATAESAAPEVVAGGTTRERELRLTGRGPAGEPIDIRLYQSALAAKQVVLGVGDGADEKIPDNREQYKVSRMHAILSVSGDDFVIEDNKSLNHTYVGSSELKPHEPVKLVHGDVVRLADVELKVSIV